MATKTISIELDVYDWLFKQKKSSRDSFSQVLRRNQGGDPLGNAGQILNTLKTLQNEKLLLSQKSLDLIEEAQSTRLAFTDPWAK